MDQSPVLLVSSDRELRDRFLKIARELGSSTEFDIASGAFEAVHQIAEKSYGAAVCIVEKPDEIGCIVRLRKARHELPVLMMTSLHDPEIRSLGEQMGASRVLRARADFKRNAEGLLRVLASREAMRRTRRSLAKTLERVPDGRRLNRSHRELVAGMMGLSAACERKEFSILVVEDSDSDYLLLAHSLKKSGLPPIYRRVADAEEAIRVVRGEGGYADRSAHPVPSLVISDLHLPGLSGMDLLRVIREDSALSATGFILYTSSERERDFEEAARLGANFYIVKSTRPQLITEIVHSIFTRFIQEQVSLPPS